MCGIVAAVADSNIVPLLIEGLTRLEYRGYDSAGLALRDDGSGGALSRFRSIGRVADLAEQAKNQTATSGIAHTRWATHGIPSERNAHPHMSDGIAVVHNGIIENYVALREMLLAQGYVFHPTPTPKSSCTSSCIWPKLRRICLPLWRKPANNSKAFMPSR